MAALAHGLASPPPPHGNLAVDIFHHPALVRLRAEPQPDTAPAPAWTRAEL
ncbi:MAG: hypothetical protein IH621_16290, partial [Krumholzibacteria bacterium]|nr:hypothetical protein [Candidatus Krumholzibacteria bacterium]